MRGGREEGGGAVRGGAVRGGREGREEGSEGRDELNNLTFAGLPRVSLLERELNTD